jgi:hypothetical protein
VHGRQLSSDPTQSRTLKRYVTSRRESRITKHVDTYRACYPLLYLFISDSRYLCTYCTCFFFVAKKCGSILCSPPGKEHHGFLRPNDVRRPKDGGTCAEHRIYLEWTMNVYVCLRFLQASYPGYWNKKSNTDAYMDHASLGPSR